MGRHHDLLGTANGGLAISEDGGATHHQTALSAQVASVATDARLPGAIAAGSAGAVWLSRDAGASWAPIGTGLPPRLTVLSLVFDPVLPSTLYAATGAGGVFELTLEP